MLYKSELVDVNGFDFSVELESQKYKGESYAIVRLVGGNPEAEALAVDLKTLRRIGRELIHFGEIAEREEKEVER